MGWSVCWLNGEIAISNCNAPLICARYAGNGRDGMNSTNQKELLRDILQGAPSLAFLVSWQSGLDIELAGWIGSISAALVLGGFQLRSIRQDPITVGINIHILLITPLVVSLFAVGADDIGRALFAYAYPGVFATMLVVSAAQVAFRMSLMRASAPGDRDVLQSIIILAVISLAGIWAITQPGSPLTQVALPIMAVFGSRRFLIARRDDKRTGGMATIAGGPALGDMAGDAST